MAVDVNEHLDLVKRIARHTLNKLPDFVELDDLVQAGNVGLLKAAKQFDPLKNSNFEAYAQTRIRGEMIDELRKSDWTPRSLAKFGRELRESREKLTKSLFREPSDSEIAEYMQISISEFQHKSQRLDASYVQQDDGEIYTGVFDSDDTNAPENQAHLSSLSLALQNAMDVLSEKELQILNLYYYEELTQAEIAPLFELSEKQISNIRTGAEKKLKAHMNRC